MQGLPCSGKTTLARRISSEFQLPLFEKDEIKEQLFDCLGWGDIPWSRKLSKASKEMLFYILQEETKMGRSIIIECNFVAQFDSPRIQEIAKLFPFTPIQVLCWAQGDELIHRFTHRTGTRHPGHNDQVLVDELKNELMKGKADPLDIGGELIEIDTTDIDAIDYDLLFQKIHQLMLI